MNQIPILRAAVVVAGCLCAPPLGAQAPPAQTLEFEVASVKLAILGQLPGQKQSGDRITMIFPLPYLIHYAYNLTLPQYLVGEDSISLELFDIEAKVPDHASEDEIRVMLQNLLADRFDLKVHREMRQLREFEVTVAKGGPKMKAARDEKRLKDYLGRPVGMALTTEGGTRHFHAEGANMAELTRSLVPHLGGPTFDRTGLTGAFDFDLRFSWNDLPSDFPTVTTALQEQLGLKVQATRGSAEVVVIDHVGKLKEN